MSPSATDKLMRVGLSTATTLSAPGYTEGAATVNVGSTSNWPATTGVVFAIDTVSIVNGVEVQDPGSYNEYIGVVTSPTQVSEVDWVQGNGDQDYAAGSTTRVYIPVSKERENRIVDWGLEEHNQDGSHSDITVDSITGGDATFDSLTINGQSNSEGWAALGADPNTITYSGNYSYQAVFNGTDLTDTISPGMRLKLPRSSAAPTQCADLESGSSQYFSKSSPSGTTFTDDFTAMAWIKLESYTGGNQHIISRYNNTSGWNFYINSTGQVVLGGNNASSANFSIVTSSISIPIGRWVHVAAQLDMSAFTATSTTSYVMVDGVDTPATVSRGGTNPTALVQAGDLNIGGANGAGTFDGKVAQSAYFNAKVTQSTIKSYISQTLVGNETSLVSAYSFNNTINDLNTGTANNLTANAGAAATTADSPFAGGSGTNEFGIVMAASFSTNTTLTIQVPEGYSIPTTGSITPTQYSVVKIPYGFPVDPNKWTIYFSRNATDLQGSSPVQGTWYNPNSNSITIASGTWRVFYEVSAITVSSSSQTQVSIYASLSTSNNSESDPELTNHGVVFGASGSLRVGVPIHQEKYLTLSSPTQYYLICKYNHGAATNLGFEGAESSTRIRVVCAYL